MIYLITYESGMQAYAASDALLIDAVLSEAQWITDIIEVPGVQAAVAQGLERLHPDIEEILNEHKGIEGVWFSPTISRPEASLPAPRLNAEKRTGDYRGQPKGTLHFSTCCETEGFHRSSKDGRCKACR
jgi:hypothetical protein